MSALSVVDTMLFITDSFVMLGFMFVPPLRRRLLREFISEALDIIKEGGRKKKETEPEWAT